MGTSVRMIERSDGTLTELEHAVEAQQALLNLHPDDPSTSDVVGSRRMDTPTRAQLENRLHALIADHLDALEAQNPEGFDLGVVAEAWEVLTADPNAVSLNRADAAYTPGWDVDYHFSYFCSDHRWWVREAMFREAHNYYQYPPSNSSTEDSEEDPEGEDDSE